jgi:hypothetical protein
MRIAKIGIRTYKVIKSAVRSSVHFSAYAGFPGQGRRSRKSTEITIFECIQEIIRFVPT